jgi:hypothetical protein
MENGVPGLRDVLGLLNGFFPFPFFFLAFDFG